MLQLLNLIIAVPLSYRKLSNCLSLCTELLVQFTVPISEAYKIASCRG
ncbi:hypothetical protein HOE425_100005 [Hoeflea sp. EC-HK425]|nr:hypothetical protein HOE425_100005 [Hoeflea sp. EC-HK425]